MQHGSFGSENEGIRTRPIEDLGVAQQARHRPTLSHG
jgi:hypothetical protein